MCHLMLIAAKYTLSAAGVFLKEASSVISFRIVRELISWCFLSQQIMSCEYVYNVFSSNDEHFYDICSYFEILEQHQRSAADLTHRLISSWLSGLSPFLGNHLLIPTSSKARCQSNVIQMYFHFECPSTTSINGSICIVVFRPGVHVGLLWSIDVTHLQVRLHKKMKLLPSNKKPRQTR